MVDNIVTKPLGLVLIITAHMVFNGHSRAEVNGTVGSSVSLQFNFEVNVTKDSVFNVYIKRYETDQTKIVQYPSGIQAGVYNAYPKNTSVFLNITNLKQNHTGKYWACLFNYIPQITSEEVQLIVRQENRSSTVPPMPQNIPQPEDSGSASSLHVVTVLVVSPVVLLAAALPFFIWCVVRRKDTAQQPPPESSNPTIQETVEESNNVPASSLVYSVLDFPKRPPSVLPTNQSDTEYAAVSYLTEKKV